LVALLKEAGAKEEDDNHDNEWMLALTGEIKEYVHMVNPEKCQSHLSLTSLLPLLWNGTTSRAKYR